MITPVTNMAGYVALRQTELAAILQEKYQQGYKAGYDAAKREIVKPEKETETETENEKTVSIRTAAKVKTKKGVKTFRSTIAEEDAENGTDKE